MQASYEQRFPVAGPLPLGLYPIVDRAEWLEHLLPLGVKTVQLRAKDLTGSELVEEIVRGIATGKAYNAHLYINDQWELALEQGAYGVHLGQDDLPGADLERLQAAGLHLGVSTHSAEEIQAALACGPSYVALGTVYPSPSKVMDYQPLGLEAFRALRETIPVPTVAIGGVTLERAPDVIAAGADGIAVISAVRESADLAGTLTAWERIFSGRDGAL
jgi:thiamine-phosphate diphosphorylase